MSSPDIASIDIIELSRKSAQPKLLLLFTGMIIPGAIAFLAGITGSEPLRAWQAYLINFVFWTGLAAGSVLFSAILSITHAHWGRPIKRLAEAVGAFLPMALFLFVILYWGREYIFPWITHPVPEKAGWLNVPFLFLRDGLGLMALVIAAIALIYRSIRRETIIITQGLNHVPEKKKQREESMAVIFANIYGILYAIILSLLAFDLIMSLSPHWHSSLFGAYYFIGSFFTALATIIILVALAVTCMDLNNIIKPHHMHNLGKLLLGFTLMAGDFFFTQFFVIWYGNLPEETRFVILRTQFEPWAPLVWVVLITCFILPFLILLNKRIKMQPIPMLLLSSIILSGMWLEKFLLITPSLWNEKGLPLGLTEVFITLGFFGIMASCILVFLNKYPVLPFADPLFQLENAKSTDREEN